MSKKKISLLRKLVATHAIVSVWVAQDTVHIGTPIAEVIFYSLKAELGAHVTY